MEIKELSPFGVEINAADIGDDYATLVSALESDAGQGVLVVRNLRATGKDLEDMLAKFATAFDTSVVNYDRWPGQSPGIEGCPSLALLGNYKARERNDLDVKCEKGDSIAEFKPATMQISEWHTDGSFLKEPKKAIALYAPFLEDALPLEGGETRFASCVRGFESLDPDLKQRARTASATHSWECFMRFLEARDPSREKVTEEQIAKKPDQLWPIVRNITTTGAAPLECLYVNAKNTRNVRDDFTGELLETSIVDTLAEKVVESGVYAHFWRKGDLVIWDNRRLLHAATPFNHEKYERLLMRAEFHGSPVEQPIYHLAACPENTAYGYLDPASTPRLTVDSGSIVKIDTVSGPEHLLPPDPENWSIPPELFDIHRNVTDRLGPHILTGPVAIRGAKPEMLLRIDVLKVECRTDWAWTFIPGRTGGSLGLLKPHMGCSCSLVSSFNFDFDKARHTRLVYDKETPDKGVAKPPWGGEMEMKPFFGIMGIAPKDERVNSIPPSDLYGGNLDLTNLVAGSTLYLPIQTEDALFFCGDGHARQGDGEVCGTALETSLAGTFRFTVLPNPHKLDYLRVETPEELVSVGVTHTNLDAATALAIDRMLLWLKELRPRLDRTDALCLLSAAGDLRITQVVNGPAHHGVHMVLPKNVLPPL